MELKFRLANHNDIFRLIELYHVVYHGTYPEPLMNQFGVMKKFLETPGSYWFIAESKDAVKSSPIIGSVVVQYDAENRLGKAFGAAVLEEFRRAKLMESLLSHAIDYMQKKHCWC